MEPCIEKESEISFPDIGGMDWEYARYKMKNDRLLLETAKDFYDLNEAEALTLERFLAQVISGDYVDIGEFRIKVHSMKSSAAVIGAVEVSALARVLENAAAEGNISVIQSVAPYFLREWRELKQGMDGIFPKQEKIKRAPDFFMLVEYLKLLKLAISDMDIDASDEIIYQIKSFRYSGEVEKKVEQLALSVTEIAVDRTVAIAEELEEIFMQEMDE